MDLDRRVVRLLFLLLILSTAPSPAGVELYGRAGFGNYYKPGEWAPVTVYAISDVPLSGQFVVDVTAPDFPPARYIQQAVIMREPNPRVIYVLMPELPIGRIDVRFVLAGRTKSRLILTSLRPLDPRAPFILNYTGDPHAMDVFKGKGLGFAHTDSGLMAVQKLGKPRSSEWVEEPISGG